MLVLPRRYGSRFSQGLLLRRPPRRHGRGVINTPVIPAEFYTLAMF